MVESNNQKALNNIEEFGCHVLSIMEDEQGPEFTYSIGIKQKQDKADLIVVGLKAELAHLIVNDYKDRLLAGESFETGKFYSDFLGNFDVCFVEVDKSHYEEYLGWALWLNDGDDFKVLQLVWPTTDGIWPWDSEKSDYYTWAQSKWRVNKNITRHLNGTKTLSYVSLRYTLYPTIFVRLMRR